MRRHLVPLVDARDHGDHHLRPQRTRALLREVFVAFAAAVAVIDEQLGMSRKNLWQRMRRPGIR